MTSVINISRCISALGLRYAARKIRFRNKKTEMLNIGPNTVWHHLNQAYRRKRWIIDVPECFVFDGICRVNLLWVNSNLCRRQLDRLKEEIALKQANNEELCYFRTHLTKHIDSDVPVAPGACLGGYSASL